MKSFKFQNKKIIIIKYLYCGILLSAYSVQGLLVRYDSERGGPSSTSILDKAENSFSSRNSLLGGHRGWAEWLSTRRVLGTLFQLTP